MQRPALFVEAQEERFAISAYAGVPVDQGDLAGAGEVVADDALQRQVGPFPPVAAIVQTVRMGVLAARQRVI